MATAIKFTYPIDLDNNSISNVASPAQPTDVANKAYVDGTAAGLSWKNSVRAASTTNITLSGPGTTIDGVTMSNGDRFLAKNQTAGEQNGIYVFNGAASAATRAADANTSAKIRQAAVSVEEGTVNGDHNFNLTTNAPITLDTTALTFSSFGGTGQAYTNGDGLALSGSQFSVVADTGILVGPSGVSVDPAVVARPKGFTIGDGAATSFTLPHNLGTKRVQVVCIENATGDTVIPGVSRSDVNNVVVSFGSAPTSNQYDVTVSG